jgi:antitoxin component YwqK of YwqJK toxin-antitoxin module
MRTLLFLAFLFLFQNSFGQKTKVIFLDENERITKEKFAEYYREVTQNSEGNYNVEGFYLSGKRQMTGQYEGKKLFGEIGSFKYFDTLGKLETVAFYEDGKLEGMRTSFYSNGKIKISENYENGQRHGEYREYYEDSTLRAEANFVQGNIRGSAKRFNKDGKLIFEMNIDESGKGKMRSFYLNGDVHQKGEFKDDYRVGTWYTYNRGDELVKTKEYSISEIENSNDYFFRQSLVANKVFFNGYNFDNEELFGVVYYPDQEAKFPGDALALQSYIVTNIVYPKKAINKGIEGKVYITFIIETDGSISNVKAVHGPRLLKKESIRIVEKMPKWQPGEHKKEKVRTICRLPIVYTLN